MLSVHDLDLNANVIVHGTRTLIILAAGNASISAVVHAEAKTRTPARAASTPAPVTAATARRASSPTRAVAARGTADPVA